MLRGFTGAGEVPWCVRCYCWLQFASRVIANDALQMMGSAAPDHGMSMDYHGASLVICTVTSLGHQTKVVLRRSTVGTVQYPSVIPPYACYGQSDLSRSYTSSDGMNSTNLLSIRRPLSGRVQDSKHTYQVAGDVTDQNVILVCDQFAGAGDAAGPTETGMIGQAASLLRKQLIEGQRGDRVVIRNEFADFSSICSGRTCPDEIHDPEPTSFRRVSARQAAASASTSSVGISSP